MAQASDWPQTRVPPSGGGSRVLRSITLAAFPIDAKRPSQLLHSLSRNSCAEELHVDLYDFLATHPSSPPSRRLLPAAPQFLYPESPPRDRLSAHFPYHLSDPVDESLFDEGELEESFDDDARLRESLDPAKGLCIFASASARAARRAAFANKRAIRRLQRQNSETDMPINTSGAPNRQPSPANPQQPSQAQLNGIGNAGAPANSMGVPNGVPHAGQQTDINYLWSVVEELSTLLAQNRAQTEGIINGVQRIQSRAREEGEVPSLQQVNGELTQHTTVEVAELHARLHDVTKQRDTLLNETQSYAGLLETYESTFNTLMDKVRHYASEHANTVIALHQHYQTLLDKERETNMQLRIEHGQWQAALGRASEWARKALKERSEEVSPLEIRNRELKAENRVLRQLVDWEVEPDSDDEQLAADGRERGAASSTSLR